MELSFFVSNIATMLMKKTLNLRIKLLYQYKIKMAYGQTDEILVE